MSTAAHYAAARRRLGVAEPAPAPPGGNEAELQARFFAGDFGFAWRAVEGQWIEAIHLGEWNREPGPDFVGARLRIDGEEREGDIELDPEDADWGRHGHDANPAFERVALHVFFRRSRKRFYTRNARHQEICQVHLQAPAAPIRPQGAPRPTPPAAADPAAVAAAIEAAAAFRLGRKREAWLRAEALHGRAEALFQALAAGMGYKRNRIPFLLVAQRVGLRKARGPSGEALLFGVAGFLDAWRFDAASPEARAYARSLWDRWWAVRETHSRLVVPHDAWSFSAVRPQNHPHRRMGALAASAAGFDRIETALAAGSPHAFLAALAAVEHEFWSSRASLDGRPLPAPCAMVGAQRAADLAANVLAPALDAAHGLAALRQIRAGTPNTKVLRALDWLGVAPEQARQLRSSALGHQGLLQLYDDFYPAFSGGDVLALVV